MASPQLQMIVEMIRARPRDPDISIEEARKTFEEMASVFPAPEGITAQAVSAGGIPGEWITARGASDETTIYWLHGGGYCIGSVNTHRSLLGRLSMATGARVLAIDYRLAPEDPFPAGLEDAVSAYLWLLGTGVDPQRIIIGGDSAGGGLALATLIALRDGGKPLPAAAVCISPWTDLEGSGDSVRTRAEADPMIEGDGLLRLAKLYVGDEDPRSPLVSPVHADLSALPPTLVQVGDSELLLDDSTRVAERAKAAGTDVTLEVWDEMVHVWHFFAGMLPEGQQAIDRIGEWVRERVGATVAAS